MTEIKIAHGGTVGTPNEKSANWLSLWLEDLENHSGRIPVHGPVIIQEKENAMEARSVGTFVQIGETAINLALVERVVFGTKYVHLYYLSCEGSETSTPTILGGDARLAFLDWWERQAEVTQDAQSPPRLVRPPNTSAWKVTPGE